MAPVKTTALILKLMPYRESSYIIYLFTRDYGIVHAIAKGLRKQKAAQNFLERGFLIEVLLYMRPNRDLHTAANIQVTDFFPDTRKDLIKSAIRDTIFESSLCFLTQADPHGDLFLFLQSVLDALENNPTTHIYPVILWHFFHKSSALLGFELNLSSCIGCGQPLTEQIRLEAARGGFLCTRCSPFTTENQSLPRIIVDSLTGDSITDNRHAATLHRSESKRVTYLLADFCRLHFDIRHDLKALDFLNSMTDR